MFPDDEGGFEIDDQYFIGDTGLLVKPAVKKDVTSVEMYLAEDQVSGHFLFDLTLCRDESFLKRRHLFEKF